MPGLDGVVRQRLGCVGKRLLIDKKADAPGILGHHVRAGIASSGCPRTARGSLPCKGLCVSYPLKQHGRSLALRIGCDSKRCGATRLCCRPILVDLDRQVCRGRLRQVKYPAALAKEEPIHP
eukprot:8242833-Pyramimonas_sp.AAC.1